MQEGNMKRCIWLRDTDTKEVISETIDNLDTPSPIKWKKEKMLKKKEEKKEDKNKAELGANFDNQNNPFDNVIPEETEELEKKKEGNRRGNLPREWKSDNSEQDNKNDNEGDEYEGYEVVDDNQDNQNKEENPRKKNNVLPVQKSKGQRPGSQFSKGTGSGIDVTKFSFRQKGDNLQDNDANNDSANSDLNGSRKPNDVSQVGNPFANHANGEVKPKGLSSSLLRKTARFKDQNNEEKNGEEKNDANQFVKQKNDSMISFGGGNEKKENIEDKKEEKKLAKARKRRKNSAEYQQPSDDWRRKLIDPYIEEDLNRPESVKNKRRDDERNKQKEVQTRKEISIGSAYYNNNNRSYDDAKVVKRPKIGYKIKKENDVLSAKQTKIKNNPFIDGKKKKQKEVKRIRIDSDDSSEDKSNGRINEHDNNSENNNESYKSYQESHESNERINEHDDNRPRSAGNQRIDNKIEKENDVRSMKQTNIENRPNIDGKKKKREDEKDIRVDYDNSEINNESSESYQENSESSESINEHGYNAEVDDKSKKEVKSEQLQALCKSVLAQNDAEAMRKTGFDTKKVVEIKQYYDAVEKIKDAKLDKGIPENYNNFWKPLIQSVIDGNEEKVSRLTAINNLNMPNDVGQDAIVYALKCFNCLNNSMIKHYSGWDKFWSLGENTAKMRRTNQLCKIIEDRYTKNLTYSKKQFKQELKNYERDIRDKNITRKPSRPHQKGITLDELLNLARIHPRSWSCCGGVDVK